MNPTTTDSQQKSFSPIDTAFRFTPDGWYEFDGKAGKAAALKARAQEAKEFRAQGYTVKLWTMPNQLLSLGGIGTGKPHIETVVNIYFLDAKKKIRS